MRCCTSPACCASAERRCRSTSSTGSTGASTACSSRPRGEPFLENTLRPLHTIFRRTGWIYHSWVRPDEGLGRTVECHLAILEAVADKRVRDAVAAADQLVSFSDSMFDVLGRGIDPTLFDCNLEMLSAG